jgi:hypothetical protein
MRSVLLRVAVTVLTLTTAVAAAVHVSGHPQRASAPLHPQVRGAPAPSDGRLHISPSVRTSDAQPVTSTHLS